MSIIAMKKIILVGPVKYNDEVLKSIQLSGVMHIVLIKNNISDYLSIAKVEKEDIIRLQNKVTLLKEIKCIYDKLLNLNNKYTAFSKKYVNASAIQNNTQESFWENIYNIEILENRKKDIIKKKIALEKQIELYKPWGDFNPKDIHILNQKMKWNITIGKMEIEHWNTLDKKDIFFKIIKSDKVYIYTAVVHKNKIPFLKDIELPGKNLILMEKELKNYINDIGIIENEIIKFQDVYSKLSSAILFLLDEINLLEVKQKTYTSNHFFALKAYVPNNKCQKLEEELKKYPLIITKDTPSLKDDVPILLKNNWFFQGFEEILKSFSGLSYHEKDVTPIVGVLFFLFGSLCLLDGGYGFLLCILGIILIKKKMLAFGKVFLFTGFFSVIIGLINGQIFGFIVGQTILREYTPPMNLAIDPLACFKFSLLIGLLVMGGSYITSIWQRGFKTHATGNVVLVFGLVFYLIGSIYNIDNTIIKYCFLTIFCLTIFLWILFPEIVFGKNLKIPNIIWTLYSGLTGLVQDILSHMRLFGISLSGAILALVVNEIGSMLPIYIMIPFCIGGHFFVFLLALLSLFVHTNRLIFLEFGSKCIDGGHYYYLPLRRSSSL